MKKKENNNDNTCSDNLTSEPSLLIKNFTEESEENEERGGGGGGGGGRGGGGKEGEGGGEGECGRPIVDTLFLYKPYLKCLCDTQTALHKVTNVFWRPTIYVNVVRRFEAVIKDSDIDRGGSEGGDGGEDGGGGGGKKAGSVDDDGETKSFISGNYDEKKTCMTEAGVEPRQNGLMGNYYAKVVKSWDAWDGSFELIYKVEFYYVLVLLLLLLLLSLILFFYFFFLFLLFFVLSFVFYCYH